MNKNFVVMIVINIFLIITFLLGCSPLKVSLKGETHKLMENNNIINQDHKIVQRVGIIRLNTDDVHVSKLFNNFCNFLTKKYPNAIVKNYDPTSGMRLNRYVVFDIKPEYEFNRGTSVAVSWPGCFVFAPSWWGLEYTLQLTTKIAVYDGLRQTLLDEIHVRDTFRVRHSSAGRVIWLYTLGLHPIFGLPSGAISGWDEDFKSNVADKIIENDLFNQVYFIRFNQALFGENKQALFNNTK
jgi:hypothetical protein